MKKAISNLTKIIIAIIATLMIFGAESNVKAATEIKYLNLKQNENVRFMKVDISTLGGGNINMDSGMSSIISKVFGVVQYCCIVAAIIVIMISGVKYMSSAPEEKADIKKQAIALVIGAVIVFSISTILRIIANITIKIM